MGIEADFAQLKLFGIAWRDLPKRKVFVYRENKHAHFAAVFNVGRKLRVYFSLTRHNRTRWREDICVVEPGQKIQIDRLVISSSEESQLVTGGGLVGEFVLSKFGFHHEFEYVIRNDRTVDSVRLAERIMRKWRKQPAEFERIVRAFARLSSSADKRVHIPVFSAAQLNVF